MIYPNNLQGTSRWHTVKFKTGMYHNVSRKTYDEWAKMTIGSYGEQWRRYFGMVFAVYAFKNKEHAVQFKLTWLGN